MNTIKNNKSELLDVKDELPHVPLAAKGIYRLATLQNIACQIFCSQEENVFEGL